MADLIDEPTVVVVTEEAGRIVVSNDQQPLVVVTPSANEPARSQEDVAVVVIDSPDQILVRQTDPPIVIVSPFGSSSSALAPEISVPAYETMTAPALVNVFSDAGTAKARYANATAAGKEATGFISDSVASGATAIVYVLGEIEGLAGLTPGRYYLSTTSGAVTATAPSASGNVVQYVGTAHSATEMMFEPEDGIILA